MKIGLLPLYIELYDNIGASYRTRLEPFYETVAKTFEERGIEVIRSEFCRIKPEFKKAISTFEEQNADVIVTLHMAYSPSLESIEYLTKTSLPIIVLDTTETLEFTPTQDSAEIDYNHGIHGVMDMCSMLKRYKRPYTIVAGHFKESDVMDRACRLIKATVAAKSLNGIKVARVGGSFEGMGDFLIPNDEMKSRFGVVVDEISPENLASIRETVTESEIDAEIKDNEEKYTFAPDVIMEEYRENIKACLTMRKCLNDGGYSAFTANFLSLKGIGSMPFIESCKAMERGIGYAGEGDALTAAFVGAFMKEYPETNFVEIFCPDWKNNVLFLSHMGEINFGIADEKPYIARGGGNLTDGSQPYRGFTRMKPGKGVYVNISRDSDDFQILSCECEMLSGKGDTFKTEERGWLKPIGYTTQEFLELNSKNGGTHHSIFIYGATNEEIGQFAKILGTKCVLL